MTRKKVVLTWIVNDSARKASLRKRKVGLLKKVSELNTLCGVSSFVIIYSPDDNEPAMWPSPPEVQQLVERFQSLPEMEVSKKLMNQETYLKERVAKLHEQFGKLHKKNKVVEVDRLMHQLYKGKTLDELNNSELQGLEWLMQEKKKETQKRIDYSQPQQVLLPPGSLPPEGPAPWDNMGRIESSGDDGNTTMNVSFDQWFAYINSENVSNARSNIGLPHNSYVGSSSIANDMGDRESLFSGQGSNHMGLPLRTIRGQGGSDMWMQPHENIGGGSRVNEIGPGLESPGTGGASTGGSEMELPFGIFGSSSRGSDFGLPSDVTKNNLPSNSPSGSDKF